MADRPTWPYESCLECRLRMPSDAYAEAHYAMTGHMLGWPFDEDELSWPIAGDGLFDCDTGGWVHKGEAS